MPGVVAIERKPLTLVRRLRHLWPAMRAVAEGLSTPPVQSMSGPSSTRLLSNEIEQISRKPLLLGGKQSVWRVFVFDEVGLRNALGGGAS